MSKIKTPLNGNNKWDTPMFFTKAYPGFENKPVGYVCSKTGARIYLTITLMPNKENQYSWGSSMEYVNIIAARVGAKILTKEEALMDEALK